MKLSEVMSRDVQIANPDDTLTEAAVRMAESGVGALPVCNGRKVLGMITDRDLVVRGLARFLDPETTQVQRCMSEGVQWCFEDEDVEAAARKMAEHQVRRLIVVDRDKNLVGMVALGDVARASDDRVSGDTLESISEPSLSAH
jgi:CBS domain-containing protein